MGHLIAAFANHSVFGNVNRQQGRGRIFESTTTITVKQSIGGLDGEAQMKKQTGITNHAPETSSPSDNREKRESKN